MAAPNAYGVFPADERLSLPRERAGWRGCNIADIELANLGPHWIWAVSFQMWTGDHLGSGSPLKDVAGRRAPSRSAAIDEASGYLSGRMVPLAGQYADARAVLIWLGDLQPAQADLFGMAA